MNKIFIVIFIVIVIVTVIYNTRYKEHLTDLWDSNAANSKITRTINSALNNALNGLRSVFTLKTPGTKPCPPGMDDALGSCWKNPYGRGAGRDLDWEGCPSGSKDVAGTCWLDSSCKTFDNGYYNYSFGCGTSIAKCHDGSEGCKGDCYKTWIVRVETTGCPYVTKNIGDRARFCRGDEDQWGTRCYPKCRAGFHATACCVCTPNEGAGIKLLPTDRYQCPPPGEPDYRKLVGALCYYDPPPQQQQQQPEYGVKPLPPPEDGVKPPPSHVQMECRFDPNVYYKANPDVKAAGMDAGEHYVEYGINEGRSPCGIKSCPFNHDEYYKHNPDVKAAGMDAAQHFKQYGIKEGRLIRQCTL